MHINVHLHFMHAIATYAPPNMHALPLLMHRCWLPHEEGLIAAFIIPMLAIIAVSTVCELCFHVWSLRSLTTLWCSTVIWCCVDVGLTLCAGELCVCGDNPEERVSVQEGPV